MSSVPSLSISAEDATSKTENRKKSTKKEFEINFDDDIDFDVYFGKAKVCTAFCTFLNYSLHSSLLDVIFKNSL